MHSFDADRAGEPGGHRSRRRARHRRRTDHPQVGLYLNDTTGAKMSYYLRYEASRRRARRAAAESRPLTGKANLQSLAPADAASTLPDYVTGGRRLRDPARVAAGDGTPLRPGRRDDREPQHQRRGRRRSRCRRPGRSAGRHHLRAARGPAAADLIWTMRSGADQTGDVDVLVTPGVAPEQFSSPFRLLTDRPGWALSPQPPLMRGWADRWVSITHGRRWSVYEEATSRHGQVNININCAVRRPATDPDDGARKRATHLSGAYP